MPTTDTGGMVFNALPDGGVTVGIRSLERLWAFCWIFAWVQIERERVGGGQQLTLPANIKQLLYWAYSSATDECSRYPQNGPIPQITSRDLQMQLGIELFRGASAGILFHELAHILKHGQACYRLTVDAEGRNKAYNHSLELEADKLAYDYVFTEWKNYSCDAQVFTKRVILFGNVFTFLLADAAFAGGPPESHTHPSPFRRLDQFMNCLEMEFPQMKRASDAGLLWVANFVYAITASLWKERVVEIEFNSPQEVLSACERVFRPGMLQDYANLFHLPTPEQARDALKLLGMKKRLANKLPCPCSCGKRLGKCRFNKRMKQVRQRASRKYFRTAAIGLN